MNLPTIPWCANPRQTLSLHACATVFFAVATACGACQADTLPECPPTIQVSQAAQAAPDDWVSVPYSGPQRLSRVTLKVHGEPGELRAEEQKSEKARRTVAWNVDGLKDLELVCEYTGTLARVAHPITGKLSRCEVREIIGPGFTIHATSECH